MGLVRTWVACVFVLFAAGCGEITTTYPIGTTTGLVRDEEIVGTWGPSDDKTGKPTRTSSGATAWYVHILPLRGGAIEIVTVLFPENADGVGELTVYRATTARLAENRYFNITPLRLQPGEVFEKAPISGTIPYLYRFEADGDLAVFRLNEEKVVTAIQSSVITGTITERTYQYQGKEYGQYRDVEITAAPMALDAFMARPEATELFEPMGRLKRIN